MTPKIVGYKIWNIKTGLYSKGGGCPKWNKIGKTWATLNALRNHFAVIREFGRYVEDSLERKGLTLPPKMQDRNWRVKETYPTGDCRVVTLVEHEVRLLETYL